MKVSALIVALAAAAPASATHVARVTSPGTGIECYTEPGGEPDCKVVDPAMLKLAFQRAMGIVGKEFGSAAEIVDRIRSDKPASGEAGYYYGSYYGNYYGYGSYYNYGGNDDGGAYYGTGGSTTYGSTYYSYEPPASDDDGGGGGGDDDPQPDTGDICVDLAAYIPSFCSCTDGNAKGTAVAECDVDCDGYDTISLEMDMDLCSADASVTFKMIDGDTGLEFDYTVDGDSGVGDIPTGIEIGVPDVGDVEIILAYDVKLNADAIEFMFGVDLEMTVMGFTEKCSDWYPDECPQWFLDTTMQIGTYCD